MDFGWLERARAPDVALALAVIGSVAMVVVPLPTFALDLLLTTNICIAVTLLLVALYVPSAVRLSTFPAILLLTTLFRLALNVSSTRLILLQADAGEVIDAFGNFVVQGNYVVGAVIFAILTVVQFVVVARGGERVAEVAARFTLDAMPGRQLAIDADLRSESITLDEARSQRAELQREAQIYGAMDGAMKFVKGDAIAGLVIIAVNIGAGLVIGMVQLGMGPGEALRTYTILTVGDGLVSQLPALLIATAAAIVVTRVSEPSSPPLGDEIVRQLSAYPRALGVTGALLVGLAFVPGLPLVPFLLAGGAALLGARAAGDRAISGAAHAHRVVIGPVTRFSIHVSEATSAAIEHERERFDALLRDIRDRVASDLGVALPNPRIRVRDAGPARYKVCIDEVAVESGALASPLALDELAIACERTARRHIAEFVDLELTQAIVDRVAIDAPALAAAVAERFELRQLTELLRRLVAEDVSIRNIERILSACVELDTGPVDTGALVDAARERLARHLVHQFADADQVLRYYQVDRELEDMVVGSIRRSGHRAYVALPADVSREIVDAIAAQTRQVREGGRRAVLVTEQPARAHLRQLIAGELPEVVVLARQELGAGPRHERAGWIRME